MQGEVKASERPAAEPEGLPRSWGLVLLGALLLAGLLLRLHGLSYPPYDHHSFRQTQTLSTAEAFYRNGIDLLHPTAIYMGYPGTFVLEIPLFQALVAVLYHAFGPHIEIVRLLNILFGLGTAGVLYCATRLFLGRSTAVFAAGIYTLAPLNVVYQRSMLIDPIAVLCAVTAFYTLALLLPPEAAARAPMSIGRQWLCFGVFAATAWVAVMIKALYLWPAVLFFGYACLVRRFKGCPWILRIVAWLGVAGVCFLAWNYHAARVNNTSVFARGASPVGHLGISALFSLDFYRILLFHRPKWWLGPLGVLLYPVGLWAAWAERSRWKQTCAALLVLIPPTYLAAFSSINRPHEYYQLIITPFLAIVAGDGLRWLVSRRLAPAPAGLGPTAAGAVALLVATGAFTYLGWLQEPWRDPSKERFERLCAGKVEPWSPGMVFVDSQTSGAPVGSFLPEFLYPARLWGYARAVGSLDQAREFFDQYAPAFPRLDSVVFYGTPCPDWMQAKGFRLAVKDERHRFYLFQRDGDKGP